MPSDANILEGDAEFGVVVMQHVTTSTDRTSVLIDSIASHLRHPGFGGVSGDAGEGNAPRLQVEKEEDVIGNETTPSQDLNGEEVCSGKDGHVSGHEVFQSRSLAAASALVRCRAASARFRQSVQRRGGGDWRERRRSDRNPSLCSPGPCGRSALRVQIRRADVPGSHDA